jgi:hypothetical protein
MREVNLYTADYNMNNKILGREIMAHAERQGLVAPEQYGSRKKRSAIAHALNKQLAYSLVRVLRSPAAMCSNDAQGCYDRIVHSVASLSLQRVGAPIAPILSMFSTLQNLQHYVRTAFGDSTVALHAAEVHPVAIQGVGQGNGAVPQVWALVSTLLLDALRQAGYGARFLSPLSRDAVFYSAFSFVDDTDIMITDVSQYKDAVEVALALQDALTQWEGSLRATGGALEPLKSHWYLIDFEVHNGTWRYASLSDSGPSVSIRDRMGELVQLEQVPVVEVRRTLGVFLAPDGNSERQAQVLLEKAQHWADHVRSRHLSRCYTWQALSTVLMAQLSYPLPVTTLSRTQCAKVDKVI